MHNDPVCVFLLAFWFLGSTEPVLQQTPHPDMRREDFQPRFEQDLKKFFENARRQKKPSQTQSTRLQPKKASDIRAPLVPVYSLKRFPVFEVKNLFVF